MRPAPDAPPRPDTLIRPARMPELRALSGLCLRAAAAFETDREMLRASRRELVVTPDSLLEARTGVLELDGRAIGIAQVAVDPDGAELMRLHVDPDHMRRGHGSALLGWAVSQARALQARRMDVACPPYAAGFFQQAGAMRAGEREGPLPSSVRLRLVLPL
ncbi:GNAT family N-acetyltransferase [Glycocaulis profundi]|nr:GNAT family N-acetyltransferase [Glycocaulis profundi]